MPLGRSIPPEPELSAKVTANTWQLWRKQSTVIRAVCRNPQHCENYYHRSPGGVSKAVAKAYLFGRKQWIMNEYWL